MQDYKERYDVGTFGTDNPGTAVAESMPFVVQVDGKNKFVNIGIVSGAGGWTTTGENSICASAAAWSFCAGHTGFALQKRQWSPATSGAFGSWVARAAAISSAPNSMRRMNENS